MNIGQSRKRKLSVTHEDAQSSRGPQKDGSFSVCAPSKVRKLEVGSRPYEIEKLTKNNTPKSRKRAYSDSDLSTDRYADTRRKKKCFSVPSNIKKNEDQQDESETVVSEPTASTSNGLARRKKTRRGKRKRGLLKYEMGNLLGSGSFGDVYAARRKRDNLPVAIKFLHKSNVRNFREMDDREFPIEAFYQRQVSHPNVIQLLDIFKHRNYFVFVLERPENSSDLFDYLNERLFLTEDESRQLFTNILDATIQCEKQGVIHRDIKPENIIVDLSKMEAKLTDFCLACDARVTPFRCFVGTKHYCPPEFYSHHRFYGNQATVWQLGFLLAEMITGEMPYVKPRMALHMTPSIPKHVSKGSKFDFMDAVKRSRSAPNPRAGQVPRLDQQNSPMLKRMPAAYHQPHMRSRSGRHLLRNISVPSLL